MAVPPPTREVEVVEKFGVTVTTVTYFRKNGTKEVFGDDGQR
jgi:hypothetical protein